jgi:hypothetical protein
VAVGVASGDTSEPGVSYSFSVRAGYFNSKEPLSSKEIDAELTGPFDIVGGHIGLTKASFVRNAFTHGIAEEFGVEVSTDKQDVAGVEFEIGYSWRVR